MYNVHPVSSWRFISGLWSTEGTWGGSNIFSIQGAVLNHTTLVLRNIFSIQGAVLNHTTLVLRNIFSIQSAVLNHTTLGLRNIFSIQGAVLNHTTLVLRNIFSIQGAVLNHTTLGLMSSLLLGLFAFAWSGILDPWSVICHLYVHYRLMNNDGSGMDSWRWFLYLYSRLG